MPVYEKYLAGKSNLNVLDVGCGNGGALMARLGKREEVSKIIGVEFNESFVDANCPLLAFAYGAKDEQGLG